MTDNWKLYEVPNVNAVDPDAGFIVNVSEQEAFWEYAVEIAPFH